MEKTQGVLSSFNEKSDIFNLNQHLGGLSLLRMTTFVLVILINWWTQRTGKAKAAKTLPKRKSSSGKASRKRMQAYRELAFGDTTNWMQWEARTSSPSTERFWKWWHQLHSLVEHLDDEEQNELLWILDMRSKGIRKEDQGEFRRRYNGLRKRAREKASSSKSKEK